MNPKDLQKQLEQADMDSVGKFMKMFDRMLLYTIAVNFLPAEAIDGTVGLWDKVIKQGIDDDATNRTDFLESSPAGRLCLYRKEPDGEELRLHYLKQWEIARNVITSNLSKDRMKEIDTGFEETDDLDESDDDSEDIFS